MKTAEEILEESGCVTYHKGLPHRIDASFKLIKTLMEEYAEQRLAEHKRLELLTESPPFFAPKKLPEDIRGNGGC